MSIDPKLQTCTCGYSWKPNTIHKILMLVFGDYSRTCPRCGNRMKFRLIHHVVKVESVSVKDKGKVWRNG